MLCTMSRNLSNNFNAKFILNLMNRENRNVDNTKIEMYLYYIYKRDYSKIKPKLSSESSEKNCFYFLFINLGLTF